MPGGGSVMRIARKEEVSRQVTEKQSPSCWGAEHVRWGRQTETGGRLGGAAATARLGRIGKSREAS